MSVEGRRRGDRKRFTSRRFSPSRLAGSPLSMFSLVRSVTQQPILAHPQVQLGLFEVSIRSQSKTCCINCLTINHLRASTAVSVLLR